MGRLEEDLHDELLARIASRYFLDGMIQNDIAAAEHLSRPSVSRLLAEARDRGVVQFKIGRPVDRARDLEMSLLRGSPLRKCVVATGKPRSLYGSASRIGYVAARYLETQLPQVRQLGVASSRSLSCVVAALAAGRRPDLTVVDLLGCLPSDRPGDDERAHTARVMAGRLGASFRALPAAFVYRSEPARSAALASVHVRQALDLGPLSDMAVVGIGSMQRFDGTGLYSPVPRQDLARLAEEGAVGHLCGHFIRADGSPIRNDSVPLLLGIGADELRRIPRRIAVAAGQHKVLPIAAAINGDMISELVTDHATASGLLSLLQR
jgi:deoxyribonucleoside regulator